MKIAVLVCILSLNVFAGIIQHPYMYLDTDNPSTAIFIHWKGGEGSVHYGIGDYASTAIGTDEVHLTGLVPHAKYQWFLVVDGDTGEMGGFQLDPGAGNPIKMVLFGDTQYMDSVVVRFFQYAHSHRPDLIIIVGDLLTMNNSMCVGCNDFDRFFNFYPALFANALIVPVKGNHDSDIPYFQTHFPHIPASLEPSATAEQQIARNYMVDYGNVSLSVNANQQSEGWSYSSLKTFWTTVLNRRIADNTLRPIVIGLSHYGAEGSQYVGPVYETRHGAIWYNGHEHYYMRTKWLQSMADGGIASVSETQAQNHMVYCYAGQAAAIRECSPGGGCYAGCWDESSAAYHNCSTDPTPARLMSVVEVTGQGVITHKAFAATNQNGTSMNEHPVVDSFTVDKQAEVAEFLVSTAHEKTGDVLQNPTVQAFPNPFNPATQITVSGFSSRENAPALAIHDLTGKKIAQIAAVARKGNTLEYAWDAAGLPAGVYIAAWRCGSASVVMRLALVK